MSCFKQHFFLLTALSLSFLSGAQLFDDSGQKSGSFPARQVNFFARLSSSEQTEDFSLFFSGLDDDVPHVGVVVLSAGRRPGDLGVGELPGDRPGAKHALVNEEDNSTIGDLKNRFL
jgi:hypothetical protein